MLVTAMEDDSSQWIQNFPSWKKIRHHRTSCAMYYEIQFIVLSFQVISGNFVLWSNIVTQLLEIEIEERFS